MKEPSLSDDVTELQGQLSQELREGDLGGVAVEHRDRGVQGEREGALGGASESDRDTEGETGSRSPGSAAGAVASTDISTG